jgi:serine/threonine protein kinase/Tfp pilus assembly protein PilF
MNEKHPREEAVFDGAVQLPPEQREAYLKATCAADVNLMARVLDLIRVHEQGGGPLDEPAVPPPKKTMVLTLPPVENPGDKIGHYKILQLIGEGGCGSVFMAEQEQPVRRRVALKIIKLGMDTKEVIARFEAERQALALMEHPNIAKVLDAGATDAGRPYFVMELVRGIKITDYCDQNNLDTPDRLKLFAQVCRAIQHAHQKGIIHRDIKPSNILVTLHDGVPVPKVIDFGIAKATNQRLTDKTLFTQFEQFIGTPAYMSPEQAEMSGLDIDTRSDVYSLGVLLYELLTSRTPFDPKELMAAGLDAMRRAIREQEPQKPSTKLSTMLDADLTTVARQRHAAAPKLIHLVKGDLDWIVMKSLEKDRTRRYETASSFAGDIENFLKNEPVIARPPSTVYRFEKLVRRNKLAFTAAAAVAASVIIGLVVSTWLFIREKEARRLADSEAKHSQQVAAFLEDMLKGVGPSVALGRDTTLLREILDKTVVRVTRDLKDQPEVQAEICNTIGEVYRALGQLNKAEEMHRDARTLQGRGAKRADVATSLSDLALVLRDQGKLTDAEALQREALELRRKLFGNEHADVALSLNNLALVLRSEGKLAESEKLHREALAMQKKILGSEHLAVATSLNNLGLVLRDEGNLEEAEKCFRESLAMQKKILGDGSPVVSLTMDSLAFVLRDAGKLDEAEALDRESLTRQRKLFGQEHPSVATALNNLALILGAQGRLTDAEELHREALAMRRKLLGTEHPEVAVSLDNLALLLRKEKKLAEAEPLEREALALRKKIYGDEHLAVAGSLNNLALILHDERKLAESEGAFKESLAMEKQFLGGGHPSVATTLSNFSLLLRDENKLGEAEAAIREALEIRRKKFGEHHASVTTALNDLKDVLVLEGKSGNSGGNP